MDSSISYEELQKKYHSLLKEKDDLKKKIEYHEDPSFYPEDYNITEKQCYRCKGKIICTYGDEHFDGSWCYYCNESFCTDCLIEYMCKFCGCEQCSKECFHHGCMNCKKFCCDDCSDENKYMENVMECEICNLVYCSECPKEEMPEVQICGFCGAKIRLCFECQTEKNCSMCNKRLVKCVDRCNEQECIECYKKVENLLEEIRLVPPLFKSHPGGIEYQDTQEEFKKMQGQSILKNTPFHRGKISQK